MVRLKAPDGYHEENIVLSFQFHYGTIKRLYSGFGAKEKYMFQFHYGTIKRIGLSLTVMTN